MLTTRCDGRPDDFDLFLQTAKALIEQGDPEKAVRYVNHALTLRPGDAGAMAVVEHLKVLLAKRRHP
jgi:Flp pilus assembly protein TadD